MPTLTHVFPAAALPGGELTLHGSDLGPGTTATLSGVSLPVMLARPTQLIVQVPESGLPGDLVVRRDGASSEPRPVDIGVSMAENLHPVGNPAVDLAGNVYATLSGSRGQQTPVSVFRISPPTSRGGVWELRPFAREIMNASGLAFGPDGLLYVSSRADGIVYRVGHTGIAQIFAEGLGIATGLAFDKAGDLYVGDRSGTIFKIRLPRAGNDAAQETFVFATLEPSIAAFHLAFDSEDTLYVSGPTTSSSQAIHAIDRKGDARVFYRGLGRAQGLAFAADDTLYVAASLAGERGLVRISRAGKAELAVSAPNLVGLCLLPGGGAALATRDAVYAIARL